MVGYYPKTLDEALKILDDIKDVTIFAGGTDLMVTKRIEKNVLFINKIEELSMIDRDDEYYYMGACMTYTELIGSDIPDIMKTVFSNIASPAIRNRGTIGGNICNASPAGDSLPMLYTLDAMLELRSAHTKRIVPIRDFIKGVRKKDINPGEILCKIMIPVKTFTDSCYLYYKKVGARRAEAISKLSFFGKAEIEDGKLNDIKFSYGAMGPTVVMDDNIQNIASGTDKTALADKVDEIMKISMEKLNPIDDQRSTAEYRKTVAENLLNDFLTQIINKL